MTLNRQEVDVKRELLLATGKVQDALEMYSDGFLVSVCFTAIGATIFNTGVSREQQAVLLKLARDSYAALDETAKGQGL